MFKKSPLKSSKLVKQKRRTLYLKSGGVILLFILIIGLLTFLSNLSLFKISTVSIEGNSAVDAEELKSIVDSQISGKYFMLFSRANRFLYPQNTILNEIRQHSMRIKYVGLNVNKHNLGVSIIERDASYTWCAGMPQEGTANKCYFIDSEGYVFSESPIFSGNAYFAFYGEVPNENPLGARYLDATLLKDIDALIKFLNSKELHPFAFHSHDNGVYDLYLERGGKIIFKKGQDIPIIISNLDLIVQKTSIFSKKATSTLEYIDFRFGNKLFYKTKGDNALLIEN